MVIALAFSLAALKQSELHLQQTPVLRRPPRPVRYSSAVQWPR